MSNLKKRVELRIGVDCDVAAVFFLDPSGRPFAAVRVTQDLIDLHSVGSDGSIDYGNSRGLAAVSCREQTMLLREGVVHIDEKGEFVNGPRIVNRSTGK